MLPTVAIVGRPNVGKSTLFNRLIGERKAIVHDRAGVTRDRNYGVARQGEREVLCIDTGGLDPEPGDDLFDAIRIQVTAAIAESDVVLFVVDRQTGLTPADRMCAQLLRSQVGQGDRARKMVLVINKCDSPTQQEEVGEFWELGLDPLVTVSAEHARGILDLWDIVNPLLGPGIDEPEIEGEIRIAVIGRPNIGKSTLVNRLLGEERHVVHDEPGTTMDAIDSLLTVGERTYRLVDTAGVRRKAKVDDRLETFAVARAIKTIERCHVSLLLIDGEVGPTDQDAHLAALVVDRGRALVVVVNRWDVVQKIEERTSSVLEDELQTRLPHATWAPVLYTSALTGKGCHKIFETVEQVYQQFDRRIPTAELNRFVEHAVTKHTPAQKHHHPVRFHYATQTRVRPPTIVLWANSPDAVQAAYLRYLENQLRQEFGFQGTPLRVQVRKKRKPGTAPNAEAPSHLPKEDTG
jgi:GTPase